MLGLGALSLEAQRGSDLSLLPFEQRLWYGGGFQLGFSGGNNISLFQLGLSPMAGYKFTNSWSAGPRFSLLANFYTATTFSGQRDSAQPITWGIGAFTRLKITPDIFTHFEYEYANEAIITTGFDEIEVIRARFNNFFVGGGYSAATGLNRFEMLILYNINQDDRFIVSPWQFRFGVTRNF